MGACALGGRMEISELIYRLNQELDQLETSIYNGFELIQPILKLAPENRLLIQVYAYLNTMFFFTTDARQRIGQATQLLDQSSVSPAQIRDLGENLSELLGRILEAKIGVDRLVNRWENLT